mgnify:CR=1 FL=1
MLKQRTLKTTIKTTGVGLHTGARVEIVLRPAPPDTGIVFHRVDLAAAGRHSRRRAQRRRYAAVVDARAATAPRFRTVEHLMSALAGLGIDNLHVDVAGPEIPIMDGSAGPFVFLLQSAGIVEQAVAEALSAHPVDRSKCATATSGRASIRYNGFKLDFTIDFPHPMFGSREPAAWSIDFAEHSYVKEVGRARARSASCRTSRRCARPAWRWAAACRTPIVLDEYRVLNSEGLRYDNEFVKHKVLDAIGDLYLLGHPLIGKYTRVQVGTRAQQRVVARAAQRVRMRGSW